jgi:5-methylcytosine-specific restriction endonuclease McrA
MAQLTARQQEYRQYLKSPRWHVLRWLCKVRDLGACQDCRKHGRIRRYGLQAHHVQYTNKGGSFWRELGDLVTLCDSCHAARHGKAVAND